MVPAGSTLTLDVRGTATSWLPTTPAGIRAAALDDLSPFFDVPDLVLSSTSILGSQVTFPSFNYPYTGVLTLRTRVAYGDTDDVASIVANAFYNHAGSVPTVTVRGYGVQQSAPPAGFGFGSFTPALGLVAVIVVGVVVLKFS